MGVYRDIENICISIVLEGVGSGTGALPPYSQNHWEIIGILLICVGLRSWGTYSMIFTASIIR